MVAARAVPQPGFARLLPTKARTFAFAARFLPGAEREAVVVLYAFCRVVDDLVDEPPPGLAPSAIRAELAAWRRWLLAGGAGEEPEPRELARALRERVLVPYRVPVHLLVALLDGVESDLEAVRVPDFPTLRRYAMQVAGTVGLAMCHILNARQPEALYAASELGIAMQLTNVLRDVGADLRRDRIYLPADELDRFGYSEERLRALAATDGQPDEDWRALLQFQIARARNHYARGLAGVWALPPRARPAILIAGRLYAAILDAVEANGYDVLQRRAATSRLVKAREAAAALLAGLWGRQPAEHPSPRAVP